MIFLQAPDVLATRASLARWTVQSGDEARAHDQFAALLPIYEQVQGAEHPDTLAIRTSLASWTKKTKDAVSDAT